MKDLFYDCLNIITSRYKAVYQKIRRGDVNEETYNCIDDNAFNCVLDWL